MATFTVTTLINRPLQEVFDFMTDPANFAQWQNGTKSAKWASEGSVSVGSKFNSVGEMMGREMKMDLEVTQWDPPHVWGIRRGASDRMKVEAVTKFESKDGGTQVGSYFHG